MLRRAPTLQLNEENAENNDFFSTRLSGAEYQTAYIDLPEYIPSEKLGEYANKMREQAIKLADEKRKYLKASKRAFNYFLSIGNIAAMEAIRPIFQSDEARVNQEVAVMEAIGLVSQTEDLINQGLQEQVNSIFQTYLRPYHQDISPRS